MKNFGARWLALAAASAAIAGMSLNGCGGGDGGTGTAGKGGTTGSAGKGGTTGSAGTGGSSTSTAGTGGSTSTAGTTGTAGKGGTTGSAGTTGSGGAGGGLLCPQGTFDTALEGFALNSYMDPNPGAAINLAVCLPLNWLGLSGFIAAGIALVAGLALRALAILRGWSLPAYRF